MARQSAGLLPFRMRDGVLEVLLAHPGGPFWSRKDLGAWSVVKGEMEDGEEGLHAAVREFREETGIEPRGPYISLGSVKQKGGKVVHVWICEADIDADAVRSNEVRMEWPKGSGRVITFPEIDRCAWFGAAEARRRINPAQADMLERLESLRR